MRQKVYVLVSIAAALTVLGASASWALLRNRDASTPASSSAAQLYLPPPPREPGANAFDLPGNGHPLSSGAVKSVEAKAAPLAFPEPPVVALLGGLVLLLTSRLRKALRK